MISLGLNKPIEYPDMYSTLKKDVLLQHIAYAHVRETPHLDFNTKLWYVDAKRVEEEDAWDETLLRVSGLITRGGRIIGRSIPKVWGMYTEGMPESEPENFADGAEITDMLDGIRMTLYPDVHGRPALCSNKSFSDRASTIATELYLKHHQNAQWPDGHTPVFVLTGPDTKRVRSYLQNKLTLIALVRREDGDEVEYYAMADWAGYNGVPVVEPFLGPQHQALQGENPYHRGWVFRWRRWGLPSVRVAVENPSYVALRKILTETTPEKIWERMKEKNIQPLHSPELPEQFRSWVQGWERLIGGERHLLLKTSQEKFEALGLRKHPSEVERRALVETITHNVSIKDGPMIGMLFAMLDGKEEEQAMLMSKRLTLHTPPWGGWNG